MKYGRVSMFTFVLEGKIFLQERGSYSKRGEEWSFFGGHLMEGEDFEEGCMREVLEELSLKISKGDIQCISNFTNVTQGVSDYSSQIFISREYEKYKKDISVCEGESGRFFSFEEARKLRMFSHDYMVLENIEKFLENEKH